jgi:hypothetical protein
MKGKKWSKKYKESINCTHPKGFSQKQHCKYGRKKVTPKGGNPKLKKVSKV